MTAAVFDEYLSENSHAGKDVFQGSLLRQRTAAAAASTGADFHIGATECVLETA